MSPGKLGSYTENDLSRREPYAPTRPFRTRAPDYQSERASCMWNNIYICTYIYICIYI